MQDKRIRCEWCLGDAAYIAYHDEEWGEPSTDERHLFEMLILEGAQAGLSWLTILRKRDHYRRAFAGFDVEAVADFGVADRARLLEDAGIVRNRAKIDATIGNARAWLDLRAREGSIVDWLWGFVDGQPIINRRRRMSEIPTESAQSRALSSSLKKAGFRFVGPTICYSYMQAVGMVNDHVLACFRHPANR